MPPFAIQNSPDEVCEGVEQPSRRFTRALKSRLGFLAPLMPLSGLILVVSIMAIATKGTSVSLVNLKLLTNQFATLAVVATCSSFIFSMGGFDISLGAVTCLAAVVGAAALNGGAGAPLVLLVCVGTAVGVSLFSASCVSIFKLPSFLVTLAVYLILTSSVTLIMKGEERWLLREHYSYLDTNAVKLGVLAGVVVLSGLLFNYMKLGRQNRIIGGSQTVARYTGMSIPRNTLLSFLVSGVGLGIAAFLLMGRSGSVSVQTGQSYGFDVIIAIVLGGMPISGGARSRITAGIVGAFTLTAFNNGLVILGAEVGTLQATRGALFLIVVSLLMVRQRERLLAK